MTIEAAELIARVRADYSKLPSDMASAEGIIKGGVAKMVSGAGSAGSGIGASLGKGVQSGLASFLGGGAGMLLGGGLATGVALIGKEFIGAASEAAEYGRQQARIGASFVDLWGTQAPGAMSRLRDASQGTINDMDLMLAANKASLLGVGAGIDDLTKLMQVAQNRGQAMGLTTTQAFSDIVTGIGRMSPMILDNLGIVMNAEQTYGAYAATLGKSADALTDLEKKQALVNRVTAEAGETAATSATSHTALQAAKENLRGEIGLVVDSFIAETGVVEGLTTAFRNMAEAMREHADRTASIADAQTDLDDIMASMAEAGLQQGQAGPFAALATDIDRSAEAFRDGRKSLVEYNADMAEFRTRLMMLAGDTYPALLQQGDNWAASMRIQKAAMDPATVAVARLAEREAELASQGVAGAQGTALLAAQVDRLGAKAAAATPELRALAAAQWAAVQASQGAYDGSAVSTAGYYTVYDDRWELEGERAVSRANDEYRRGTQGRLAMERDYASESVSIAQQQFDDIRGIVQSALSPTAVTAADMAATAAGAYVDKWDEYMRRVRMPSSGFDAAGIAEQERLFYSGQMMDQINWGAVVSDVERKVAEEAGKEAMMQEAMRQVAAAGLGASQSQVAGALGITGYAAGTGEAEQMAKGLSAMGLGIQFTDEFAEEFAQQQGRWVDMGALSVQWMAAGIEQGTTPGVTALLVNLLAPRLAEVLMGPRP